MRKPDFCLCENKGADQLRSNCEADQRLCFRYTDSTISPLLKDKISRFWLSSVIVQAGLCRSWSETTLLVFPRGGSFLKVIAALNIQMFQTGNSPLDLLCIIPYLPCVLFNPYLTSGLIHHYRLDESTLSLRASLWYMHCN